MQIGWVDPNTQRRMLFEDALNEARLHGDALGFPYEILNGMYQQVTKKRPDGMSVTTLIGNPRHVKLEKQYEYFAEPQQNYATFRGNIVHTMMEEYGEGASTVEERGTRDFDGVPISRSEGRSVGRDGSCEVEAN